MLNNKIYDVLKYIAQFVLPAVATLYFGLARLWNFPYPEQVVGTIMALDAFLGAILGISVIRYNKKIDNLPSLNPVPSTSVFGMSNSTYDIFYWVAQIVLPALGTLYFALASLWALPYAEQILGTIALLDAFLGIFLGVNTTQYKKLNSIS